MAAFLILRLGSYVAMVVIFCFITLCLACGLYYLSELVEEYSTPTKRFLRYAIWAIMGLHVLLLLELPFLYVLIGLASHGLYYTLLDPFPFFHLTSWQFIGSTVAVLVEHLVWFSYFGSVWHPFAEVIGFFTLCVWMVPFVFFISLSANEEVLPLPASTGTSAAGAPNYSDFKDQDGKGSAGPKASRVTSVVKAMIDAATSYLPARGSRSGGMLPATRKDF